MRILNAEIVRPVDLRTGRHCKEVRPCRTPFGTFRSVSVARDEIMTKHPTFYWDLIGKPGLDITKEAIARRVYYRIYMRCQRGDAGYQML